MMFRMCLVRRRPCPQHQDHRSLSRVVSLAEVRNHSGLLLAGKVGVGGQGLGVALDAESPALAVAVLCVRAGGEAGYSPLRARTLRLK